MRNKETRVPFGNYVLTADSNQWIIVKEKRSKKTGEVYDRPVAFCSRLGDALSRLAEQSLRDSGATTLSDLRSALDAHHSACARLLDPRARP